MLTLEQILVLLKIRKHDNISVYIENDFENIDLYKRDAYNGYTLKNDATPYYTDCEIRILKDLEKKG